MILYEYTSVLVRYLIFQSWQGVEPKMKRERWLFGEHFVHPDRWIDSLARIQSKYKWALQSALGIFIAVNKVLSILRLLVYNLSRKCVQLKETKLAQSFLLQPQEIKISSNYLRTKQLCFASNLYSSLTKDLVLPFFVGNSSFVSS